MKWHPRLIFFLACLWLAWAGLQVWAVQTLQPTPATLAQTRVLAGEYRQSGGGAKSRAIATVQGESLFCSISYLGPNNSCSSAFSGMNVRVVLAPYRHVFGTDWVVTSIRSAGTPLLQKDDDRVIGSWRANSAFDAVSVIAAGSALLAAVYILVARRSLR